MAVFIIRNLHRPNIFLSKHSVLFLREVIWVHSAAEAINVNGLVSDLSQARDEALQLKDKYMALQYFADHCSEVLNQWYTILQRFMGQIKHV